jgi:hypothetical protein
MALVQQPPQPPQPKIRTYITRDSLENHKPVQQILRVSGPQFRGFAELLKTFREQDYYCIQTQKVNNPKIKKLVEGKK